MGYGSRPLFPPSGECCGREHCVRMPLFGCETCRPPQEGCGCGQRVRLENPCCPGEYAEVALSVDDCGNLVISIHRDSRRCGWMTERHRRGC